MSRVSFLILSDASTGLKVLVPFLASDLAVVDGGVRLGLG